MGRNVYPASGHPNGRWGECLHIVRREDGELHQRVLAVVEEVRVRALQQAGPPRTPSEIETLASEIADVGIYLLRLADVVGVEAGRAIREKLEANEARFPAEAVRGRARMPEE